MTNLTIEQSYNFLRSANIKKVKNFFEDPNSIINKRHFRILLNRQEKEIRLYTYEELNTFWGTYLDFPLLNEQILDYENLKNEGVK